MREALPRGAVKAIKCFRKAAEHDAAADEAMGVVLAVMRGDVGYRGRHIGEKLRAAIYVREDRVGKPVQRVKVSGTLSLVDMVAESFKPTPDDGNE